MDKFLLLVFMLAEPFLNADLLHVDSSMSELYQFKYETPDLKEIKIPENTKLIIVSFEKSTGVLANEYLKKYEADYLMKHRAVFIADINKMPTIITKMFALPKLRKYKHPIYLNYDEEFEQSVPYKEDALTLIHVKNSKVYDISYALNDKELKEAIEK